MLRDGARSLIRTSDGDEITQSFKDYFKFRRHQILGQGLIQVNMTELDQTLGDVLDPDLRNCHGAVILHSTGGNQSASAWPTDCCLCAPCVTLDGIRNHAASLPPGQSGIRRVLIGDTLWLFFYVQMGIHQILGAILDAFACTGRLPISNGSLDLASARDDITALILEIMVRQTQMGMSPRRRDLGMLFRTTLGWGFEARARARSRHRSQFRVQHSFPSFHL